ncbi:MAG: hypothetical protein GF335_05225 [Candidatus Moranbacteria bacterium]|nr:hypothetical protein [Candidatus Moranbacteria bacterium]
MKIFKQSMITYQDFEKVNIFTPLQISSAISEVLVLGVPDEKGEPILIVADKGAPLGGKFY